jgi:hypothetical protein
MSENARAGGKTKKGGGGQQGERWSRRAQQAPGSRTHMQRVGRGPRLLQVRIVGGALSRLGQRAADGGGVHAVHRHVSVSRLVQDRPHILAHEVHAQHRDGPAGPGVVGFEGRTLACAEDGEAGEAHTAQGSSTTHDAGAMGAPSPPPRSLAARLRHLHRPVRHDQRVADVDVGPALGCGGRTRRAQAAR